MGAARMTRLLLPLLGLVWTAAAVAQVPPSIPSQVYNSFYPAGQATLSATTSSARVALGSASPVAWVCNDGSVTVFARLGSSTVTAATATSFPIMGGTCTSLYAAGSTHLAAITASSTTTVRVATGVGSPATGTTPGGGLAGGATATNQVDGSQKTQIVDNLGNVVATTSNNLNVQCANCSGSGVSAIDAASFTAGASLLAPTGGFYQTTATSNALTNGQQGMLQMTANRAVHVNLRNASGVALGVSGAPLVVDGSASTQPVSGTFWQATQPVSGTFWQATQPVSGTFWQATQPVSAASLPLPSGAATAALQTTGNTALTTINTTLGSPLQAGGNLGTVTAVTAITNPVAVTGTFWQATQPVSAASLPLPILAATSTKQSDGSQKTQIVDASGNVIASTSNNLNVQCANCSGSGASAADQASFTAGSSTFAPSGGFYQTTATTNPLTTGQQGFVQMTAQRAFFVNLRNASGAAIGVSGAALVVDGSAVTQPVSGTVTANAGTGTFAVSAASLPLPSGAATSAKQDTIIAALGSPFQAGGSIGNTTFAATQATAASLNATVVGTGTFAVQAAQSGTWNVTNISGTVSLPTGAATSANQTSQQTPVAAASATATKGVLLGGQYDSTQKTLTDGQQAAYSMSARGALMVGVGADGFAVTAVQSGTWNVGTVSTVTSLSQFAGTAIAVNSGNKDNGTLRVVLATDQPALTNKLLVTPDLPSGASTAANQTAMQTPVAAASATATKGMLLGGQYDSTQKTLTDGQQAAVSTSARGALMVNPGAETFNVTVNAALPAGSAVIGHVIMDSGSTTAVTQATGTNLHTVVDSGTITTVSTVTSLSQFAGTAIDVNSGNKGNGTLRVVLATDQPALTNKLLVTPDANSSVNVSQINGVTPLMGAGNTGTGSPRVTIATDQAALAGVGAGATGSAPPANAVAVGVLAGSTTGGLLTGVVGCDSSIVYDASTNGSTELVALSSGKTIRVCGYSILSGGTVNVKLIYGTGTACATGSNNMTPAYQLTAQAGLVDGSPFYRGMKTAASNALCLNTSAGIAVQAIVYYNQF